MTFTADEELRDMRLQRRIATHERIQRIDAMDEAGVDEKLERAVHGRRRGFIPFFGEFGEDLIRADRFVRAPDDLEYAASHWREVQTTRITELVGVAQRDIDARIVVVRMQRRGSQIGHRVTLSCRPYGNHGSGTRHRPDGISGLG